MSLKIKILVVFLKLITCLLLSRHMYPEEAPNLIWIIVSCYLSGVPGNRLDVAKCTSIISKALYMFVFETKSEVQCHIWSVTQKTERTKQNVQQRLPVGKTHEDKNNKKQSCNCLQNVSLFARTRLHGTAHGCGSKMKRKEKNLESFIAFPEQVSHAHMKGFVFGLETLKFTNFSAVN